jgi:cell division protein FtsI (penicillin-binding protein 3)
VNSPSKNVYYGNQVAGPVFLDIAKKVFATSVEMHPALQAGKNDPPEVPYSKDGYRDDLNTVLKELDLPVENSNIRASWVSTEKLAYSIALEEKELIENLTPNVVGMGVKDALYLLENAGLKVKVNGYGSVKNQSIPPGVRITKGDQITLDMSFM